MVGFFALPRGTASPPPARADITRTAMVGRPPTREDLIMALCPPGTMSRRTQARCEHELVALYRACGLDLANPRTAGCRVLWRRIHRG